MNPIADLPLLSSCPQQVPNDPDPSLSLPLSQLYSQIYCQGMEQKPITAVSLPQRDQPVLPLIVSPVLASIHQPADEGCLQSAPRIQGHAIDASLPIPCNTALPTTPACTGLWKSEVVVWDSEFPHFTAVFLYSFPH